MTTGSTGPDRKKLLAILGPAVGVAAIVVVVALVAGGTGGDDKNKGKGKGGEQSGAAARRGAWADMSKLSDGAAPGADDPGLKDLGDGLKYRGQEVGGGEGV